MNHQAVFSSKDILKKLKCRLLQFLFGALQVKWSRFKIRVNAEKIHIIGSDILSKYCRF